MDKWFDMHWPGNCHKMLMFTLSFEQVVDDSVGDLWLLLFSFGATELV